MALAAIAAPVEYPTAPGTTGVGGDHGPGPIPLRQQSGETPPTTGRLSQDVPG